MYSVQAYGRMIMDRLRTGTYLVALKKAIRPGSVVIDIGTGTGYLAITACRLGAARVYAIDPAEAIVIAKQIAQENGFSDKIQFIQDLSTRVTLPEQADVIVSDLRGSLPLYSFHIPSIVDARTRLLKPGGSLIPEHDHLQAALVEAPKLYNDKVDLWRNADPEIRMESARRISSNTRHNGRDYQAEQLLSDIHRWGTLDYLTITDPGVKATISFTARRAGTAHGFGTWFETLLHDDIGFSLGSHGFDPIYGRPFFPFQEPIPVSPGDVISVDLRADLVGNDYVWTWNTTTPGKVRFRQSTFLASTVIDPQGLRRMSFDYVPTLDQDGEIERFILNQMNGSSSLHQIAARVCAEFAPRFANPEQVFDRIAKLSKNFGRSDQPL